MEPRNSALLALSMLAGLLLIILVYKPTFSSVAAVVESTIQLPPPLSDLPFHGAFINEETCLNCHAEGKDLPTFGLTAPKIKHELRENCVGCHLLPGQT